MNSLEMPLKYKFFAYIFVGVMVPLVIAGFFTYESAANEVVSKLTDHLNSVATVQEERVNEAVNSYIEQAKLIASRTALRNRLREYKKNRDEEIIDELRAIIYDAQNSITGINEVTIYDERGDFVVSTREISHEPIFEVLSKHGGVNKFVLDGLVKDDEGNLCAVLYGPLILDGEQIGVIKMDSSASKVTAIAEDHTGLGETGEVILAERTADGGARFLTPLRFDADAALARTIEKDQTNIPVIPAISGREWTLIDGGAVDYRGNNVFAVTRFVDSVGWGIVAKIDRDEVMQSVYALGDVYRNALLSFLLMTLVIAGYLSRSFTMPIMYVAEKARNLQRGMFGERVNIKSKDELGYLAESFNLMAEKLQGIYKELEDKVNQRTSELEEAKAKDEAMLANIGDGLVFTDMKMKIVFVNKAGLEILGWNADEMVGKVWTDVIRANDGDGRKIELEKLPIYEVLAPKSKKHIARTSTATSYYYTRKNGMVFPVVDTASVVMLKGEPVGGIIIFRDITKDKDIDKAKTEFVSLVSHQLRTPLAAVNWYSEMLLNGDIGALSGEQSKTLRDIKLSNRRMIDLVNDLLNVSRLELGTFSVDPEPTNVVDLMRRVVEQEKRSMLRKKKIDLKLDVEEGIPDINLDPKLMWIIFENLLSNSVKYTPEGGAVTIGMRVKSKGTEYNKIALNEDCLCLIVEDTGYGIPKAAREKVFDKLYRAENIKDKEAGGTGLGLYMVKSIVEHAKGQIWFESPLKSDKKDGPGTAFYVTIPLSGMKKKGGGTEMTFVKHDH